MKRSILLTILFIQVIYAIAQDSLRWSNTQKLTWADFRGKPDTSSVLSSLTACTLSYHYHKRDSLLSFTITCYFLKFFSWSKPPLDSTQLIHAQGHFDIAEIHARIIRQRLSGFAVTLRDWRQQLTAMINEVINEKDLMNERYDRETENAKNLQQQSIWNLIIADKLKALDKYAMRIKKLVQPQITFMQGIHLAAKSGHRVNESTVSLIVAYGTLICRFSVMR